MNISDRKASATQFMAEQFAALLEIAASKEHLDKQTGWSRGSITYLEGLKDEISEAETELESSRWNYLEDELGDIMWDYANLLLNLDREGRISKERVLSRAVKKYRQRIDSIAAGGSWAEAKAQQHNELERELKENPDIPPKNRENF